MATLAVLRAKLNGELGVLTDAEPTPWSLTVRSNAITDGYAALWRAGVWKPAIQSVASVTDQSIYALTSIRRLERVEILDAAGRIVEKALGLIEDDGAGAWQLRLASTLATGVTIRVRGWGPYKSQFSGDSDTDDLPAEHNRIPLLKAKAICWRIALAGFARYGERQAVPPEQNMTIEQMLGMVAAAEREFEEEARRLSNLRPRASQIRSL